MTQQKARSIPIASSLAARRRMKANRAARTGPEMRLRRSLASLGLRFRANVRPVQSLRRTADVLFVREKLAVFVDGCFWHGCPRHATWPRANAEFWRCKIAENRRRDRSTTRLLRAQGWNVVRVWEHENFESAARRIHKIVEATKRRCES